MLYLRVEYLQILGFWFVSSATQSLVWIHGSVFYTLGYNPILHYCDIPPPLWDFQNLFVPVRCSRLILCIFVSVLELAIISKDPQFLLENGIFETSI